MTTETEQGMSGNDKEIENKLVLPQGELEAVFTALSLEVAEDAVGRKHLERAYFDTDDLALYQTLTVWRVEQAGQGRYLQTVKHASAEDIVASEETGIHVRNEWEFFCDSATPDVTAFAGSGAEAVLKGVDPAALKHIFTSEIDRRTVDLDVALPDGATGTVEIAFDLGAAVLGDGKTRAPICEIEVELKSGDPRAVESVVDRIRKLAPGAQPSVVTKSDTGFSLYRGNGAASRSAAPRNGR